jgi:gingipain R
VIVPVKRFASIFVVSLLALGLGAATWLVSSLPSLHRQTPMQAASQNQSPGYSLPLTDPDSLIGALGRPETVAGWVSLGGNPGDPPRLTVTENYPGRVTVELEIPGYFHEPVFVSGLRSTRLSLPGQVKIQQTGYPEVPVLAVSLEVPLEGTSRIRIIEHVLEQKTVDPIEPSKGHLSRAIDPKLVHAVFSDFYSYGGIWPADAAVLGDPFLLRDRRGVNIRLQPLRYDPDTGALSISKRLVLEVTTEGAGGLNKSARAAEVGAEYDPVYDRLFGNYSEPIGLEKYQSLPTRGRMLIVTDPAFVADLAPFIAWKTRLGIDVELLTTAQTGATAAEIRGVLQTYYDEPEGLAWVILVGDREQIPPRVGLYDGSDSDSRYALLAGYDSYPDVFVSRISADTRAQVQIQVAKFIAYEKQPAVGAAAAWYGRSTGIASDEGIPTDYERIELLRTELLSYGFHTVDRVYQNLGGTSAGIRTALEEGTGLINYLGHGTGTAWESVPFDINDVINLENPNRTPWIIDVSCSNGDFALNECFAETWLRAGSVSAPKGAVAAISATSLAPWIPPTVMQSEIVDLLTAEQALSLGALYYGGLMKVLDLYGGLPVAIRVMEQNVIFGDCSLMVRTAPPGEFLVSDPDPLLESSTRWSARVEAVGGPLEGAIVTLTGGDILYGLGFVTAEGLVEVAITRSPDSVEEVDLTVSGFNMVPFLGTVTLGSGEIVGLIPDPDPDLPADAHSLATPRLLGNHPNPFNPDTRIAFELPYPMRTRLAVFDIRGRLVQTLIDGTREAGRQEVSWNGRDHNGGTVASGVYLYRLETEIGAFTGRMTLSK